MRARGLLYAAAFLLFTAPFGGQTRREEIGGQVREAHTGKALPGAAVVLVDIKTEKIAARAAAGEDGQFRFTESLAPGKYRLVGAAAGHLTAAYLQHEYFSTAIVLGAGLATGALQLELERAGSITGHVTEASGDEVPGAMVKLYRETREAGEVTARPFSSSSVTEGTYRFDDLPAGRYFVAATGTPWYAVFAPIWGEQSGPYRPAIDPALEVAYPMTFYPAAHRSEDAQAIELRSGEQREADLQLVPEPARAIVFKKPETGEITVPPVLTTTVFGVEEPLQINNTASSVEGLGLVGIPPGVYHLGVMHRGRMPVQEGTVDLTQGSVTMAPPLPPSAVRVRVTVLDATGKPPKGRLAVTLFHRVEGPAEVSADLMPTGVAEFNDVAPGDYRVDARDDHGERPVQIAAQMPGGHSPNQLHVPPGGDTEVTVVVGGAPVTVEGLVRQGKDGLPGAMVLLVPAQATVTPEEIRRDQSDLDGSFSIAGVPPGDYLVVALTEAWGRPWAEVHRLAALLPQARALRVGLDRGPTLLLPGAVVPQVLP